MVLRAISKSKPIELTEFEQCLLRLESYSPHDISRASIILPLCKVLIHDHQDEIEVARQKLAKIKQLKAKEKTERARDLKDRRNANIRRFKQKFTVIVDGVSRNWNDKIRYKWERHHHGTTWDEEVLETTASQLCRNLLDNLVDEPDCRSNPSTFDQSIYQRFYDFHFSEDFMGKKGSHIFVIRLKWKVGK